MGKVFTSLASLLLFTLLVSPLFISSVHADEDELEEEEEGVVEEEGGDAEEVQEETAEEDPVPGGDGKTTTSADADTTLLFTKPVGTSNMELPAGQVTELLIGFTNKGEQEMMVDSLEASLRYPMDFTFHIQNFTTATFSKAVKPGQQATVGYSFVPADAFAGRPIGLTINLNYRDAAGNFFIDPVFNETVQIVEFDEGFATETFFMYVWLGLLFCCSFLALTISQARRLADPRRWWRQELKEKTESTTNGFPSQRSAIPLPAEKPPRGSVKIRLVLTLTEEDVLDLQRPTPSDPDATHHLDYLQQTGHCILITELSFSFYPLAKICATFSSGQVTWFTKCCLPKILKTTGYNFQPIASAPAILT